MKLSKLVKGALTVFLAFYLPLYPIKAQQKPKQVTVNKKKYSLLEDKVTTEHGITVKDKETLFKVLKTLQIQEEIDSLQLNPKALKFLELYAKGQELTIKYNEHIDWILRLPAKILANITIGQKTTLEDLAKEVKDLTTKKLKETAEDIAKDPEKQLKHLAYEYFSQANEKAKFNLTILRKKPKLDYKTAVRFEDNGDFIYIFIKPSQDLYHNIERLRKLEERWTQTFLQEIEKTLPEGTEKITDFLLQKYEDLVQERLEKLKPYEKFQKEIAKRKQEVEKSKTKKQKKLEEKVEELVKKIKADSKKLKIIFGMVNEDDRNRIYIMDEDGKNLQELLPKPKSSRLKSDYNPTLSPDQKEIVFYTTRFRIKKFTDKIYIGVYNLETEKLRKFTPTKGHSLTWSPDSKKFVFVNEEDIFTSNSNGTNLENLTKSPEIKEYRPCFSTSGEEISYIIERKTGNEIWIMNKKGDNKRKLTKGQNPKWSPNRNNLLFTYKNKLYTINSDGGKKRTLTPEKNIIYYYGLWSPDGKKIICVGKEKDNHEIYLMNSDGTNKINLTNNSARDEDPYISPNGDKVVFCSKRENMEWNIFIMKINGKNVKRLVRSPSGKHWIFDYNINLYQQKN